MGKPNVSSGPQINSETQPLAFIVNSVHRSGGRGVIESTVAQK